MDDATPPPPQFRDAMLRHRNAIVAGDRVDDDTIRHVIVALSEAGAAADRGAQRADLSRALAYWTGQAYRRRTLSGLGETRLKPYSVDAAAQADLAPPHEATGTTAKSAATARAATARPPDDATDGKAEVETAIDFLRMSNTAYLWKRNKDSGALFDGKTLERARQLAGAAPGDRVLREFLDASEDRVRDRATRAEEARKRARLHQIIAGLVLIAFVLIVGIGIVLYDRILAKAEARREGDRADKTAEMAETSFAELSATKELLRKTQAEVSDLQSQLARATEPDLVMASVGAGDGGESMLSFDTVGRPTADFGMPFPHTGGPIMDERLDSLWNLPEFGSDAPALDGTDDRILLPLNSTDPNDIATGSNGIVPDPQPRAVAAAPPTAPPLPPPFFAGFLREGLDLGPPVLANAGTRPIVLPNALLTLDSAGTAPLVGTAMLDRSDVVIVPVEKQVRIGMVSGNPIPVVELVSAREIARNGADLDSIVAMVGQNGNLVPVGWDMDVGAWDSLSVYAQFGFAPAADRVLVYSGATYGPDGVADRLWKVLVSTNGARSGRDLLVEAYCLVLPVAVTPASPEGSRLTLAELSHAVGAGFDDRLMAADRPKWATTSACAGSEDISRIDPADAAGGRAALDRTIATPARPPLRDKAANPIPEPSSAETAATLAALALVPGAVWDDPAFGAQRGRARLLVAGLTFPADHESAADNAALIAALGLDAPARTVQINFAGLTRARIDALRAALLPLGWDVARATRTETAEGQSVLRHAPEDTTEATRLRHDLAAMGWNDVTLISDGSLDAGQMEIWLSL